jgi:hypothetical protein
MEIVLIIVDQVIHGMNPRLKKQQVYHAMVSFKFQDIYPVHSEIKLGHL